MIQSAGSRPGAPVKHGVEGGDFIHPHWCHFKELGNIVHDANTSPSLILPLTEVKERNNGGFLVLCGIA